MYCKTQAKKRTNLVWVLQYCTFEKFTPSPINEKLLQKIKIQIRKNASPRHVPAKVIVVNDIPRTKNGKIVELAVKNIIEGNKIKNKEALANPEVLKEYKNLKELNY